MGDFSREWLALREPFDHGARCVRLTQTLRRHFQDRGGQPLRVVDLACGRGSNLRYLAPRLPGPQRWLLVDQDPELLADAPGAGWMRSVTVEHMQADLRQGFDQLPGDIDLVVASALLDLASEGWLEGLAAFCRRRQLPLLAALTVDGRIRWNPPHPLDPYVDRHFKAHQLGDRGFGPSPGWQATRRINDRFVQGGFSVLTAPADWQIGSIHRQMLSEMARGIAGAAAEMSPNGRVVRHWRDERLRQIEAGVASLMVGHLDLLALPPVRLQRTQQRRQRVPQRAYVADQV
ncbi:MAG: class I SAM-dependent methyltransferase [Myxococcota bacterium]